jgi:5'-3' exoribonuclease 2
MTSDQFESYGKSLVFQNIMKREDLDEQEKMKLAEKTLQDIVKKQLDEINNKKVEAYTDKVQFGKHGWKERYYHEKMGVNGEDEMKEFCKKIRQSYIEGLSWVYAYYYNGCVSWGWYYPYHYAPFASDLLGCDTLTIQFELGEPAKPFE